MNITWPTAHSAEVISKMRDAIGRNITIYINVSGVACAASGCTLDPVTNYSTNSFCETCGGNYWLQTTSAWVCMAHIRWGSADQPLYSPGGIVDEGTCKVTIAYSGNALNNVRDSHHFVVDDKEMYLKNYAFKGVQTINRLAITLKEDPNV